MGVQTVTSLSKFSIFTQSSGRIVESSLAFRIVSVIGDIFVEAFADLPDPRRQAGKRHHQAYCLALYLCGSFGEVLYRNLLEWLRHGQHPLLGQGLNQLFSGSAIAK